MAFKPVWVCSDLIYSKTKDSANIKKIIDGLTSKGVTAHQFGAVGEAAHLDVLLKDISTEPEALVVELAGGVDAGAIYEKGSDWYKSLLGKRDDVIALMNTTKIRLTGLEYLKRPKSDNYSPSVFKGVEHPDWYLYANGYDYMENISPKDFQPLINWIANEATIKPVKLSQAETVDGVKRVNQFYKVNNRLPKIVSYKSGSYSFKDFTKHVKYYGLNYDFLRFNDGN